MIKTIRLLSSGQCCVCDRKIPEGKLVLMHDLGRIICVFCVTEIAESE